MFESKENPIGISQKASSKAVATAAASNKSAYSIFTTGLGPTVATSAVVSESIDLDKSGLWNIILVLSIVLIVMVLVIFGGMAFLGGTVGETLNFIADTIAVLGTKLLQIFNGVVHELTSFMLPKGSQTTNTEPSTQILPVTMPTPLISSNPSSNVNNVQPNDSVATTTTGATPTAASSSNWCLVGEFNSKRSCVQIENSQKCLSGLIFPTLDNCLVRETKVSP